MIEASYSQARQNFKVFLDRAADDGETILVKRRNGATVAMIAADELSSILETAHLLRSPANARRLGSALKRARAGRGRRMTLPQLRSSSGL
jgi:antitoxin YefM